MGSGAGLSIATEGLVKRFESLKVVDGIDLEVPRGTIYGFLGQNGAGKTTTMRMLLGLIQPSQGRISILGEEVSSGGRERKAARLAVAQRIGALVEGPSFYPFLSARKNLELFARLHGITDRRVVEASLDRVGLLARCDDLFRVYSRGMKQRLGIAATLIHEPELVLLDEPMNGLDPPGVILIRELLLERAKAGMTIFLSSHLLNDAEQLCSHVGILHRGRLVAEGELEELCRSEETIVEVEVDDTAKARGLLEAHEAVREVREMAKGSRLSLTLEAEQAGAVNAALVGAGVEVRALVPRGRSLESVFLANIEGAPPVGGEMEAA